MADTHDYDTTDVRGDAVNDTHTLVGESGGLASVYENAAPSTIAPGLVIVQTEHGALLLDPDKTYPVLAE